MRENFENKDTYNAFELAKILENTEDPNVIKENLSKLLRDISLELETEMLTEVNDVYEKMKEEDCLVRVEKLSRIMQAIEEHTDIPISDETESHYANAVIPEPTGIKIAFGEGQAPGPVRIAVGFDKTIVGFKTDNIEVQEIDFNESDIRDKDERKYLCRHVVGNLKSDDIKFIVIRIPRKFIAEGDLTDDERELEPQFVFRAFDISGK